MFHKRKLEVSCVTAGGLLLLLIAIKSQMLVTEDYTGRAISVYQAAPLCAYVLLAGLICTVIMWSGKITYQKISGILAVATLCAMPSVSFFMFEMIAGNFLTVMHNKMGLVLLNLMIWYLLYAIVFAVTNRVRITVIFLNTLTYIFGLANAFVVQFREQPIMIMDVRSLKTAMSVAGEYEYIFTVNMILMGLLMVLCNLWVSKIEFKMPNWKYRITYIMATSGCVCLGMYGIFAGNLFEKAGSTGLNFFRFNLTYQTDGYMVSTMQSMKYLRVEEPEGYSVDTVRKIAESVPDNEKKQEELPENVIVIMNESFADLSVLGDFNTSEDVLSDFYHIDNAKRGYTYVSAYGGGTANSEFEFLTGNSVANIPSGTVAYQMYVDEGDSSIVSLFKQNGYHTIAFHPYRKDNYNRIHVYDIYGFDDYYGKDDVKIKKLRKYASDKSDYKNLIKMYEGKEPGEKLFIFNVTMQNHAGYDYEKYENTVSITDCPGMFPQTEQYLSLMKESDKALRYLIDYFSQVNEKTVILLFGDHQPRLEDGFYEMAYSAENVNDVYMDFSFKKHMTPYILWSNYPLNAEEKEYTSTNYLGSYLLKTIGMDMPVYNRYLLELEKNIPAVNYFGYLDKNYEQHMIGEDNTDQELLDEYKIFQYNNLFDKRNRLKELY